MPDLLFFPPFIYLLLALISKTARVQKCKKGEEVLHSFLSKRVVRLLRSHRKHQAKHLHEKFPFWVPNKPKSANLRTQMTCRAGKGDAGTKRDCLMQVSVNKVSFKSSAILCFHCAGKNRYFKHKRHPSLEDGRPQTTLTLRILQIQG